MYRETSRQAYYSIRDLGAKQKAVYDVIKAKGMACNLDIAGALGLAINSVTPRTNELVNMRLVESAKKGMTKTGRCATFWRIKEDRVNWNAMIAEVKQKQESQKVTSLQSGLF
jgi:predicted ArsR family transcriptional regulator